MPRPARELRDLGHVGRLGPLRALALLVGDSCALRERLEALAGDAAVMHEQVLSAFIGSDEAVALAVVEPLDGSVCHKKHLLHRSRTGEEGAEAQTELALLLESRWQVRVRSAPRGPGPSVAKVVVQAGKPPPASAGVR